MTEWSFKLLFVSLPILMMYRLLDRRGVTCKGTDRREGTALASASQWTWKATGLNQPAKSTERKEFDEALPYLLGRWPKGGRSAPLHVRVKLKGYSIPLSLIDTGLECLPMFQAPISGHPRVKSHPIGHDHCCVWEWKKGSKPHSVGHQVRAYSSPNQILCAGHCCILQPAEKISPLPVVEPTFLFPLPSVEIFHNLSKSRACGFHCFFTSLLSVFESWNPGIGIGISMACLRQSPYIGGRLSLPDSVPTFFGLDLHLRLKGHFSRRK